MNTTKIFTKSQATKNPAITEIKIKCQSCGEIFIIKPGDYRQQTICQDCAEGMVFQAQTDLERAEKVKRNFYPRKDTSTSTGEFVPTIETSFDEPTFDNQEQIDYNNWAGNIE